MLLLFSFQETITFEAGKALREAADIYLEDPIILKLRNMQAMHKIGENSQSTVVFPINFPIELYLPERYYRTEEGHLKLDDVYEQWYNKKEE